MKWVSTKPLFVFITLCLLARAQSNPQAPPQDAPAQPPPAATPQVSNAAQTLQVYADPKANQTPEKQAQDESQCFQWAQGQAAPSEQQQQHQVQQVQATDNIRRAYSACMESHNYTVK